MYWRRVKTINRNVTISANRILVIGTFQRPDSLTSGFSTFSCCVLEYLSWSRITGAIIWVGELLNQERDLFCLVSVTVVVFVLPIVFVDFLLLLLIIVATGGRFQTAWHQERASTRSRHQNCHRIPEYWSSCTDLSALNKNLKFFISRDILSLRALAQSWHSSRFEQGSPLFKRGNDKQFSECTFKYLQGNSPRQYERYHSITLWNKDDWKFWKSPVVSITYHQLRAKKCNLYFSRHYFVPFFRNVFVMSCLSTVSSFSPRR